MKNLQGCLIYFVGGVILSVAITGAVYVHEMSPTWNEIARRQAEFDMQIAKANALTDIQAHEQRSMAINAGSWVIVALLLGIGGVFCWKEYDKRQESWARPIEGQYALQTFDNGQITWKVDVNKSFPGNAGFDRKSGLLGERGSGAEEASQLTYNLAVQKTRTLSAGASQPVKYSAHAKLLAGAYDREPRQIAQTPAQDDGDPVAIEPILTLKQAVAQSTPEAWIIGQNQETGKLAYFKPNEAIHLAILGATGTGKTESTGMLIVGYALRNGYRTIILDGKGGADWRKFERWCEYVDTDSSNFVDALRPIQSEYERRCELLRFENAPVMQPMLVLIEEYGDINDTMATKARAAATLILDTLIRKARNTGIHLCFIDQYPEKWDRQLLNNTKNKVVYWLNNGNIVNEYHVHKLAENGEFMLKGHKYAAWHVKPMVKAFLSDVPAMQYPPLSVRPSVEDDGGDIPLVADKRADGQADITDLQAAVLQWRRDNPDGIQADCIRAMATQGLTLSRQYASDLWKIQLDASPMTWKEEEE